MVPLIDLFLVTPDLSHTSPSFRWLWVGLKVGSVWADCGCNLGVVNDEEKLVPTCADLIPWRKCCAIICLLRLFLKNCFNCMPGVKSSQCHASKTGSELKRLSVQRLNTTLQHFCQLCPRTARLPPPHSCFRFLSPAFPLSSRDSFFVDLGASRTAVVWTFCHDRLR